MLDVENLSVNYRGISALEAISLSLLPGEQVGLIGPNGAGKSTLIKAILGLIPCRGQVLLWGKPVAQQRQRVAYVPQRSQIDWNYPVNVWTVVMMAHTKRLGWCRHPGREAKQRTEAALDRVNMLDFKHRPIGQLSGGQQQRVFLARALAQQAELFLLDEPFSGIDKQTEAIMADVFAELCAQRKTLLVCNHEWGDDLNRYDRLLLLNRCLLADDRPHAVMTLDNIQRAFGSHGAATVNMSNTLRLAS